MSPPEPSAPRRKYLDPVGLVLAIIGGAALVWNAIAFGRPVWKTVIPSDGTPFLQLFGLLAAAPTLIVLVLAWFCLRSSGMAAARELRRTRDASPEARRALTALVAASVLVMAAAAMTVYFFWSLFFD